MATSPAPGSLLGEPLARWAVLGFLWLTGLAVSLAEQALAYGQIPTLWIPIGMGFLLLVHRWDARSWPSTATWIVTAAMVLSFYFTAILYAFSVKEAAVMALANVAGAYVSVLTYGLIARGAVAAPRGAFHLIVLMGSALAGSAVAWLAGGFPGHSPLTLPTSDGLWWALRSATFTWLALVWWLALVRGERTVWRARPRPHVLVVAAICATTVAAAYLSVGFPTVPLSWLLVLPAIWAGSTYTPAGAAWHMLFQNGVAAAVGYFGLANSSTMGTYPLALVVDAQVVANTFLCLVLALLRDDRKRLTEREVSARLESERHTALMSHVLDAVSEGVIVVREGRGIVMMNPRARALLGRPVPPTGLTDWITDLGLEHVDGRPFVRGELPGQDDPHLHRATARLTHSGLDRVLDVSSWPLSGRERLFVLFDVTAFHLPPDPDRLAPVLDRVPLDELLADLDVVRRPGPGGHLPSITLDARHAVLGDRVALSSLFDRLLSHAIAHTPASRAADIVVTSCPDEQSGLLRVEVSDAGVGIASGDEELLFRSFGGTATSKSGLGSRLAECRTIVHQHGGTIHAAGNPRGGMTVSLTLPSGGPVHALSDE